MVVVEGQEVDLSNVRVGPDGELITSFYLGGWGLSRTISTNDLPKRDVDDNDGSAPLLDEEALACDIIPEL